jgi:MFS family permease
MSTIARTQGIFASRSFSLFYAGQALSYLGDGLRTLAIPLFVYHLTGSALSLGITYALEFVPLVIFGPIGGALADRLDRRRLMIVCDFVRFSVIASFAIAYPLHKLTLPWLYTGIAVIASCAAFFVGSQQPSLPYMLGKRQTGPAVAALVGTEQAANMIVPPVGGALFALMGPLPALVVNAVTYLLSQCSLLAVPTLGPDNPSGAPAWHELVADIKDGLTFALRDGAMRAVACLACSLNFFGIMAGATIIPFLERDLGATTTDVGISFGFIAAGSVIGSLVAGRFGNHLPFGKSLIAAYILDAVIFIPVLFAHQLWVGVLFFALASMCGAFEVSQMVAWRLRVAPEDKVGRVSSAVRLIVLIGLVPGTLIGGWIAQAFTARDAMWVSTIGFALTAFFAMAIKDLRNETR